MRADPRLPRTGAQARSVASEFERVAAAHPDATAVQAGDERLSYRELDRHGNRVAHHLRDVGVLPGEIVGVLAERGIATVVAMLGVVKAGAAYLPLDPESPGQRLEELIELASCRALVASEAFADRLRAPARKVISLDRRLEKVATCSSAPLASTVDEGDLFAVMFTSGSTGLPKAIALEHGNLLALLRSAPELAPLPGEGALHTCAAQFDVAAYEIWATLLSGARLVCHPPGRPDPRELCSTVADHDVRWMAVATSIFHQLAEHGAEPLAGMRIALVGGEPLLPRYARRFRRACPRTRLVNIYGPAETTVFVCAHELEEMPPDDSPIPVGRPIRGARLLIRGEHGEPVRRGEAGQLYIGGPGLSRGYLHRADSLGATDQIDPGTGTRLHRSGDLARERADGAIEILGRLDSQVKVSGYRVSPQEIEAKLASHAAVAQAAVVVHERSGRVRLAAYVRAANDAVADPEDLRRHLAERLPSYMLPHELVVVDQLPLGPTGKLDRAALQRQTRGSDAPPESVASPTPAADPADLDAVRALFAQVLGLPSVGEQDDFLALGGDSLAAVQLLGRLRERFDVELPIAAVFEQPTPRALCELVRGAPRRGRAGLPPLTPRPHGEPAPASRGQAKALLLSELAEDELPYQSQAMHRIVGALDVAALERALSVLVARHEILRTTFERRAGEWTQRVHDPHPIRLAVTDLSGARDPEQALLDHFAERCARRLDPGSLPLASWSLARLAPDHHAFLALEHHVVHDGVSTALFLRELAAAYALELAGAPADPAPADIQYGAFAAWQRQLVASEHGRNTLAYWRERLSDPPRLELPLDRPRPPRQTYRGGTLRVTLSEELASMVRERAQALRATPFMLMLAAHCALLARYGSTEELIVGSGLANRRALASEGVIGMLVNTVALRVDLSGQPTPEQLVGRVKAVLLEAQQHQEVPFEQVVEHLAPTRRADAAPLYQTLFSFHDAPVATIELPGAVLIPRDALGNGSAKADLSVIVVHRRAGRADGIGPQLYERLAEDGLTLVWEYNSDLFDRASVRRMHEHYTRLLERFAAPERGGVLGLELETAAEIESRCAGPDSRYERDATTAEVFAARVAESPEAPALSSEGRTIGYRELDRRANRLAHRLRALGVGRGRRVAVCLERSVEMIVAFLAIVKAGAAYAPIDPNDPVERVAGQLRALDAALLLSLGRHRDQLPRLGSRLLCLDDELDLAREPDHAPPLEGAAHDPAYAMFTSGSTGTPNAVETCHRAIVRLVRDPDYVRLGPRETLLGLAPAAFDASTFEIWGALLNGGRLALAPPGALTTSELAELVERERVTTMWLTAGLLRRVVEDRPELLGKLRQLLSGGEALSPAHARRALDALPEGGVLINGYGPTETTTFACAHPMRRGEAVEEPVPIGRPICATRVYVLDAHGGHAPVGVPGELYIGGDGVAIGYVGNDALTAERFLPDPFSPLPGARMYRSGDLARWRADGTLEFLGRRDRQLKLRGFRVEPGEVEARLREHRGVTDALVQPLPRAGGGQALVGYVVVAGPHPSDAELRNHVARVLPPHAVPSAWVRLQKLPLTANGKIDLAGLPPLDFEREHGGSGGMGGNGGERADALERKLAAIWSRALGIELIDLDADFFALGGHSLMAVEVFDAIERSLGLRLPLATIFEAPTVRELARSLREEGWKSPRGSLVTLTAGNCRPALFFVSAGDGNSVGFAALARRLGGEQPFHALQPRGLNGGAPLHVSVERMARHYVRAIRAAQPRGPYALGGRCLGGVVAYEMARQLQRRGERVALLAILDSGGPLWQPRTLADGTPLDEVMHSALRRQLPQLSASEALTAEGSERLLAMLVEQVREGTDGTPINRYLDELYRLRPDVRDIYPDLDGEDASRFVGWAWTQGRSQHRLCEHLLPGPADPSWRERPGSVERGRERLRDLRERLAWRARERQDLLLGERVADAGRRRRERVRAASLMAWYSYRAGPYRGKVTLIRSEDEAMRPLLARWYALDTDGVQELTVRGTHRSMLREPDVQSLADCVRALAEQAAR